MSQERETRLERLETERHQIERALELKKLGGSIVWEKVACGKRSCRKCGGVRRAHGPYPYLHYYDPLYKEAWKVRKKYLGKTIGELLGCPKIDLEERLKRIKSEQQHILGH